MKLLVIGGCHIASYGIPSGSGFLPQWTAHLGRVWAEPIQTLSFARMTYHRFPLLFQQYSTAFEEADLILVQLGNYELSYRGMFRNLFNQASIPPPKRSPALSMPSIVATPPDQFNDVEVYQYSRHWLGGLKDWAKGSLLSLCQQMGKPIPILDEFARSMKRPNELLRPFASKIVMLTPFPSLNPVDHWLRRASRPLFFQEAERHGFKVLDSHRAVPLHRSYFLGDRYHLNQRGHMKMAHFLINSVAVVPFFASSGQPLSMNIAPARWQSTVVEPGIYQPVLDEEFHGSLRDLPSRLTSHPRTLLRFE